MSEEKKHGSRLWVWALAASLLLLIGLPVLGSLSSLRYVGNRRERAAGYWQSLGSPPETPVALMDAGDEIVFVRGRDGSLFECEHSGPTDDDACWRAVDAVLESDDRVELGVAYEGKRKPPPGLVVSSLDLVIRRYPEMNVYAQYVLLEDGSVWVWEHTVDANWSLGTIFLGPVCGLALAVILVLGIWLVVGARALVRRRRAKTSES